MHQLLWNGQTYVRDCLTIAYGAVIENAKGTNVADTILGNDVNNLLNGLIGNDILNGLGGNDILDGGAGADTAVFSGLLSEYTLKKYADGSILVIDKTASRDGSDTLLNIEQIKFSDRTILSSDNINFNIAPTVSRICFS